MIYCLIRVQGNLNQRVLKIDPMLVALNNLGFATRDGCSEEQTKTLLSSLLNHLMDGSRKNHFACRSRTQENLR
jgi:hypothetical protein